MIKLIFYISICSIIVSCDYGPTSCSYTTPCVLRSFSKLEKDFIDSISRLYDTIEIERFDNYECDWQNNGDYELFIYGVPIDKIEQIDTMRKYSEELVINLYRNIVEDSIIVHTPKFVISFCDQKCNDYYKKLNIKALYECTFKKETIESFCGFKIIKEKTSNKPIFLKNLVPKIDSLEIEREIHYIR